MKATKIELDDKLSSLMWYSSVAGFTAGFGLMSLSHDDGIWMAFGNLFFSAFNAACAIKMFKNLKEGTRFKL